MSKINDFYQNIRSLFDSKPEEKATNLAGKDVPFTSTAAFGTPEFSPISQNAQLKQYNNWVYAAIFKRAEGLANVDLRLFKKLSNDNIKEIEQHPIIDLLDRVNNYQTFFDLANITQIYQDLSGEAFWWLVLNEKGLPVEIWPYLRPDYMTIVPSKDDFVDHYEYQIPGGNESIRFETEEIIQFKFPNPLDPYRGYSPVKAADLQIATDTQASKFNWRFFINNGKPAGVLAFKDKLPQDQIDRIRVQWDNEHRGESNAHRMALISGSDIDYKDIGFSQKDMDFAKLKEMSRDEILAAFQVPLAVLNPNQSINRATAETANNIFMEQTIIPLMKRFTLTLNEFLIPKYGDDTLFLDYTNKPPRDVEKDVIKYNSGLQNGWLTVNEVREMEGLESMEEATKSKTKQHKPNIHIKKRSNEEIDQEHINKEIKDKLGGLLKDKVKKKVKTKKERFEYYGNLYWERKQALIKKEEKEFKDILQRHFNRQKNVVLNNFGKVGITKDLNDFNLEAEIERLRANLNPMIIRLAKSNYIEALKLIGFDSLTDVELDEYFDDYGLKFITSVNKTTLNDITVIVERELAKGTELNTIKNMVEDLYVKKIISQSAIITATELTRISNWAAEKAYIDSGVVTEKIWYTALDERVCPYCMPLHGKRVGLEINYFDEGEEYFGEAETPLNLDYGPISAPPLHVSCRCTILPATSLFI